MKIRIPHLSGRLGRKKGHNEEARPLGPGFFKKKKNARPVLCDKVIHEIVARYDMLCHVHKVTRAIRHVKRNPRNYISNPESQIHYWRCPMHTLENMEEDRFQGNHEQTPQRLSL
jgi:hypothetical protein